MTSKRRPSSSYSEELFEFVDYTSVSNLERLVTAIEEVLLSWRVKDNCYGVFSDDVLTMAKDAFSPTSLEYSRQESISVGDDTYKLSYHCHPNAALSSSQVTELPYSLGNYFYFDAPLSSGETSKAFHPLHRWTGFGRFLILAPVSDSLKSKLFASSKVTVDIHQAKFLLSACAIAFSNVRCSIPVFISVGQSRYSSYTGYLLQHDDKNDLELRFNTSVISSPPLHCHMAGLQELFLQNLNASRFDNGLLPLSLTEKQQIAKGAVLTYSLKNWFNENWKQWDDLDDDREECEEDLGTSSKAMSKLMEESLDSNNDKFPLPSLPFGPYNDPLRTMTLSAVFPLGIDKANNITDDAIHSNMDALTASFWELSREFAPPVQQRAFLSTLLDQAVSSWVKDPSNRDYLAPYDDNNNSYSYNYNYNYNSNNGSTMDDATGRDGGLMRNILYAVSQNRNGANIQQGNQVTVIKSDQVETILKVLFNNNNTAPHSNSSINTEYIKLRDTSSNTLLYTPEALGLRLKYGASVPRHSFLWNLVTCELQALQDMNKYGTASSSSSTTALSNASSYMGFLKILWIEIVRQIRWHWENLIPIPNVDPYLYRLSANISTVNKSNSVDTESSKNKENLGEGSLGIDLSYNILHQKLTMINCCIYQSLKTLPKEDDPSMPVAPNVGKKASTLFDKVHNNVRANPTTAKRDSTTDRFNDYLEQLVDDTSVVSSETKDEKSIQSDGNSDISESEFFFDSMVDIDKASVLDISTSSEHPSKGKPKPASCSSSMSDVSEFVHPMSMQESFVRLNYSASSESDPSQHVPNNFGDIEEWSTGINKSPEIKDPSAYEGRSHQHGSITLLKTGTPLWVPVTQNPGFMTEDMIQQQADVFESLGTSDDATQIRAKLQSAQLYSDMQAFKAANPYATLEDFVRWHSPKDWVEGGEDQSSGCLSARMSEPTNIWQELWKCARRVPATRQRSLFNLTAEGEKALHYLECLSVHDVFSLLLPTVGLIVYDTLVSQPIVKYLHPVARGLSKLATDLANYPWDGLRRGTCSFDSIISRVKQEESFICNAISLLRKFPKQYDLVERLLVEPRTRVKEGDERAAVFNLYKNDYGTISKPSYKEYVFYMNNSSCPDSPLPQRQYVLLKDNELRLVEMYSVDGRFG